MKIDFLKKGLDNLGDIESLKSQGKEIISQFKKGDKIGSAKNALALGKEIFEKKKKLTTLSNDKDARKIEKCISEEILTYGNDKDNNENGRITLSENMTKEEEDRFIESQRMNLMNASDVTSALTSLSHEVMETIKFCEIQQTKREKIKADAGVKIAQVNAMTASIKSYLDRSFDERSKIFDNYFNVLDAAIEKGDMNLMASTLQSINSLAASSPFKDLNDIGKVTQCLSDGGEWDI